VGITVQHELIPRLSAEVSYNRRWFQGAKVTDNILRGPDDYEPFTITAPQDPRLPGGGGYPISLAMLKATAPAGAQNYVTFESDFGPERTMYWHGVDVTINARLRQGLVLQVGTTTGRSIEDTCEIARVLDSTAAPVLLTNGSTIKDLRNCRDVDPFETTLRGLASYTIPKVDVLVSGTLRSQPPLALIANWQVPNSVILSIVGRLPPGALATGNTTIDILDNDHRLYADNRRTQVDMRFAKILRFGPRRLDIGVDLSNLLNTNYATAYENTYRYSPNNTAQGGTWNNPTAVYTPRFVRWNLTLDF